ncbi:MAG: diguanylate cyclase [Lachnospiraceae bacterium]|jgi:diguanylate cyclase (GGDEF)-like protein|nr:diguanylate cyclase [Lachnospiraceae bacterium]
MRENAKYSILIVDDEKTNLDVLNHILRNEYTIYVAKTGAMALRRAREDHPDMILLDILMADMSGYDVLKELKQYDETRHIPVIFITGLSSTSDEEKGFLLGAVDYVIKPFNNSIVKARVRNHMETVRQRRMIAGGTIDILTGMPNRRNFEDQLLIEWQQAVRDGMPLSVLKVDVDLMARYNEKHGFLQGDIFLQAIVNAFARNLKRPSDYAAHIGSDEFVAILPGTEPRGAATVAEDIRRMIEAMEIPRTGTMAAGNTVSIGSAGRCPKPNEECTEIMREVEQALERAKQSGRNKVCTYDRIY